jgi:hypothetical protein
MKSFESISLDSQFFQSVVKKWLFGRFTCDRSCDAGRLDHPPIIDHGGPNEILPNDTDPMALPSKSCSPPLFWTVRESGRFPSNFKPAVQITTSSSIWLRSHRPHGSEQPASG